MSTITITILTQQFAVLYKIKEGDSVHGQLRNPRVKRGSCKCGIEPPIFSATEELHQDDCIYHFNPFRCFCWYCTGQRAEDAEAGEACPNRCTKTFFLFTTDERDVKVMKGGTEEETRHWHVWTPDHASNSWKCNSCAEVSKGEPTSGSRIEEIVETRRRVVSPVAAIVIEDEEEEQEEKQQQQQQQPQKRKRTTRSRK